MGVIWSLLMGLLFGGTAAVATGTGAFFEVSFAGFADDLLMFAFKRWLIQSADLTMWEQLQLAVVIDETKKIIQAAIHYEQDQETKRKLQGNYARFSLGVTPGVYGQFDFADAGLLWWSIDTVLSSDLAVNLAGVAGDAAVIL